MRIAIVGNVNNSPFLLAEGLRELGASVRLVITRPDPIHHPQKAGLVDLLPDWIYDASSLGREAFERQDPSIGPALAFAMLGADLAILNDIAPSLHNLLPVPIVSLLTGSELTDYASLSSTASLRSAWSADFNASISGPMTAESWESLVARQRAGIRRSHVVMCQRRGLIPASDALLEEIGVDEGRRISPIYCDISRIDASPVPSGRALRILHGAGLNWLDPAPPGLAEQDHKGTDRLLRGFGQFLQRGGEGQLILVAKGLQVAETKALALALGLESHIVWKSEIHAAEFYGEMENAHVVCCSLGSSALGQAAVAGMAAGRPMIATFHLDQIGQSFPEPWPACQAESADQVAEHLWDLYDHPERRQEIGSAARRFAETYLSPEAAARSLLAKLSEQDVPSRVHEVQRLHREGQRLRQRLDQEQRRSQQDIQALREESSSAIELFRTYVALSAREATGAKPFFTLDLEPEQMVGPDDLLWAVALTGAPPGDGPGMPNRSKAVLLEDGAPLWPPHSDHDVIRKEGGGRYSHWSPNLYFSTSDGSSPKANGRRYTLKIPIEN